MPLDEAARMVMAGEAGYKRAVKLHPDVTVGELRAEVQRLRALAATKRRVDKTPEARPDEVIEAARATAALAPPDEEDEDEPEGEAHRPRIDWIAARAVAVPADAAVVAKHYAGPAKDAAGLLQRGGRVVCLTAGQYSFIDLLRALLEVTGPADVTLSTWTTGVRDTESAAWLLATSRMRSFRMIVDRSFPSRSPDYCDRLMEQWGPNTFLLTQTHAKFAMLSTDDGWRVVVRGSLNLNRNVRFETIDIDDNAQVFAMYEDFVNALASSAPVGLWKPSHSSVTESVALLTGQAEVLRRREAAADELKRREELSALPLPERSRRIMDDAQDAYNEAVASGEGALAARLLTPLLSAEKRYAEVQAAAASSAGPELPENAIAEVLRRVRADLRGG